MLNEAEIGEWEGACGLGGGRIKGVLGFGVGGGGGEHQGGPANAQLLILGVVTPVTAVTPSQYDSQTNCIVTAPEPERPTRQQSRRHATCSKAEQACNMFKSRAGMQHVQKQSRHAHTWNRWGLILQT